MKLAFLNSHPIQYFAPLYARLNRVPSLQAVALYCSDVSLRGARDPGFERPVSWDIDLLEGYPHVFLGRRSRVRAPGGFFSLVVPELWSEIRGGGYQALVLHGYNFAACLLAFAAAKSRRIPILMRSETHLGLERPAWKRALRDGLLQWAYRHVSAFLAIGTANAEYYRSLGIPQSRIFMVPYCVDNDRFHRDSARARVDLASLRESLLLPGDLPVVLFVGKLTRRKRPDTVLAAAAQLAARGVRASVLVVGSGEMEGTLRDMGRHLGLERVVFAGFRNQVEMPSLYAAADVLVMPSESEPWGLVVNEAMCAGLPVVVSDTAGCAPDLVQSGVNGYSIPPGDADALAGRLSTILSDHGLRTRMGAASLQIISHWSHAEYVTGLRAALQGVGLSLESERDGGATVAV